MSRHNPSMTSQGATILVSELLRENPRFSSREVFAHLEGKGYRREQIAEAFKALEQLNVIRIDPTPSQAEKIHRDSRAMRRRR